MSRLVRTVDICEALIECHRRYGWRAEKEALFSPRRIDVLAIAPAATEVIAFEIKVSRQDFQLEMKDPTKRATVIRNCTQFYFVVPSGMLRLEEVPDNCGLIYFGCGELHMVKRSPAQQWELPFEIDLRIRTEQLARERREEEWACDQEGDVCDVDGADAVQLPCWMLPHFLIRPFRFQFDINAVAAKLRSIAVPCTVDFEGLPF